MNIHEYQAKEVLRGFGAPVPTGKPAFTVEEAASRAQSYARTQAVSGELHLSGMTLNGGVGGLGFY